MTAYLLAILVTNTLPDCIQESVTIDQQAQAANAGMGIWQATNNLHIGGDNKSEVPSCSHRLQNKLAGASAAHSLLFSEPP